MTNFEKYKDIIEEIAYKGYGIALSDNKPVPCKIEEIACNECQFNHGCTAKTLLWLAAEYVPPKSNIEIFLELIKNTPFEGRFKWNAEDGLGIKRGKYLTVWINDDRNFWEAPYEGE